MNFNRPEDFRHRELTRKVAEGKITCQCGNNNWEQFIYMGVLEDYSIAGCKLCGTGYKLLQADGTWVKTHDGPGGPVKQ